MGKRTKPKTEIINVTPTWVALMPLLIETVKNGKTLEGRQAAEAELMRLAAFADKVNAEANKGARRGK